MLDNYEKDSNGVIKQINCTPFSYDYSYADNYNTLPTNDIMSHLRLGYIVGSLGKMPESILDVGYGNGAFLNLAKKFYNLLWSRYLTVSNSRRCFFC